MSEDYSGSHHLSGDSTAQNFRIEPCSSHRYSPCEKDHRPLNICTPANLITVVRLLLIPAFVVLMFQEQFLPAGILFVVAATTDWVDGQVARRFHCESAFGKALDPLVDRLLLGMGALTLWIQSDLPMWIVIYIIARDLYLMMLVIVLRIKKHVDRFDVLYTGKIATALILIGLTCTLVNAPLVGGLGITENSFFPWLNQGMYSVGYPFLYLGLLFSFVTMVRYTIRIKSQLLGYPQKA